MISVSPFIATLLNDATASDARTTLGLGTAATANTGTSGTTVPLLDGNNTFSGTVTMSGKSSYQAEGANVASANDCNIWSVGDGNTVHVTGTTQINDWGTAPQAGSWMRVIFDGALLLNYNATTNDLPGDEDITTVAGDSCIVYARSTSSYQIFDYTPSDGRNLGLVSGTVTATTSGTSHDYTIPSWAKKITISFYGVSTSGSSRPMIQIGDSGGIETTSYTGKASNLATTGTSVTAYSSGFVLVDGAADASVFYGTLTLVLADPATNTWSGHGAGTHTNASLVTLTAGSKALSATLTTIRLTTVNGTDAFDAGSFNVMWE